MKRRTMWIGGLAVVAALGAGGATVAASTGESESPLTGDALRRASEAALEHVGGGTVVESETGDGGAAYEVEVRTSDGRQVEVQLDADFVVVGDAADDDGHGENDQDETGEE